MSVKRGSQGKRGSPEKPVADAQAPDDLYEEPPGEDDDLYEDEEEVLDEEGEENEEEEGDEEDEPVSRRRGRDLSAVSAGGAGLRHIAELTGKETEGITRVSPVEDGWKVEVEVVEDRRIPSSGDILALYEADMDTRGHLLSYRRVRRYRRGRGDDSGAS
ncbi:gas vesicle protein GvpO [Streptosporangium sp. NPDC006007]|uniref:gas vesicle protein GvpO n=1 Tax=Streptosporangium sp. NPDC006007 TaxID=3154575 RepID=UPI0033A6FD61